MEAVEADGGPVAAVLGRHLGKQAALRDAGRQLRGRSSVDRIASTAGRDSTSDSNRRHDQPNATMVMMIRFTICSRGLSSPSESLCPVTATAVHRCLLVTSG